MNTGREIVATALSEGTLQPFLDAGITSAWLADREDISHAAILRDEDRDAYQSLLNYWEKHGKVPTVDIFRRSFPAAAYPLPDTAYTPDELLDIFRQERRQYLTQMAMSDIFEAGRRARVRRSRAAHGRLPGRPARSQGLGRQALQEGHPGRAGRAAAARAADRRHPGRRYGHHAVRPVQHRQVLYRAGLGAEHRQRHPVARPRRQPGPRAVRVRRGRARPGQARPGLEARAPQGPA